MTTPGHLKFLAQILFSVALLSVTVLVKNVEGQNNAQDRANILREKLIEVQATEVTLQSRLEYLNEMSRPEVIEKSLAGIGSTHPEDLREERRRQLELERTAIENQLRLLAESRASLEANIIRADADAYNQSAAIVQQTSGERSIKQPSPSSKRSRSRPRRTRTRLGLPSSKSR